MLRVPNLYIFILVLASTVTSLAAQDAGSLLADTTNNKEVQSEFENRVRQYTSRREALERELPAVPKQTTSEQITTHKNALLKTL